MKDENGNILHEAQTEYGIERVKFVQELMNEGLMTPEYYTMEETVQKKESSTVHSVLFLICITICQKIMI